MDNFLCVRKFLFTITFIGGIHFTQAQEQNLQQITEENFKHHYQVELYKQFPSFPKYVSTGNKSLDEKDFETRCWDWVKTHPEYNAFLVSKMNRNPHYNSDNAAIQPATTGKGGDGISTKIQK